MSNKPYIVVPTLLVATILSLVAKKLMLPFASVFTVIALDALAVYYLVSSLVISKNKKRADPSNVKINITLNNVVDFIATLAILINIQHWRGADIWSKLTFIALLSYSFVIVKTIPVYRKMNAVEKKKVWLSSYASFLFFLIMITLSVILTPRQFHNIFYGNTYEQFVRLKYPEEIATRYIDLSKPIDEGSLKRAGNYFDKAMLGYSKEQYEDALALLNKSIDINPDNPEAYFQRGVIKLTKLELTTYTAEEAMDDFTRAIRINPEMAKAYFQRAMARRYLYANQKALIREDIAKAASIDTVYHKFDTLVK